MALATTLSQILMIALPVALPEQARAHLVLPHLVHLVDLVALEADHLELEADLAQGADHPEREADLAQEADHPEREADPELEADLVLVHVVLVFVDPFSLPSVQLMMDRLSRQILSLSLLSHFLLPGLQPSSSRRIFRR